MVDLRNMSQEEIARRRARAYEGRVEVGRMAAYREAIKIEAKRGYAGNREMERHPAYVASDSDTIAIAHRFNKPVYDVATDIVAVRLSNDRRRKA